MAVNVYIPTPFRHLVGNRASVKAKGTNVMEALRDLDGQFPGFNAQLMDAQGHLARHINVYVNQVEIRAGEASVSGTIVGARNEERLTGIFGFTIEMPPGRYMCFLRYDDRPGVTVSYTHLTLPTTERV